MDLNGFIRKIFSLRFVLGLLGGAALGYAYYHFIGCRGGSCPMWADPVRSTLVGMTFGGLLLFDTRSKSKENPEQKE